VARIAAASIAGREKANVRVMVTRRVASADLIANANTARQERANAYASQDRRVVPVARIAAASIAGREKASVRVIPDRKTDAPIVGERDQADISLIPPLRLADKLFRHLSPLRR
jgi:hypothetical protein